MGVQDRLGYYMTCTAAGESYRAFVPPKLPPLPELELKPLYPLLDQANAALGRLDGVRFILADAPILLYMYVRKEAVLSSQIEGTQSSLSDLLLFESAEAPGVPIDDVTEVSCYVAAITYGLERLKTLPLSLRLIREIHGKLMDNARGGHKTPGEFRRSQNWIGGSRPGNALFVPTSPDMLMTVLGDLESFLHDDTVQLPVLVKAALVHAQFETIHPFLDGNGRLGRLLITFMLCAYGVLKEPLLYLSLYLKTHRNAYYDHLQSVRLTGDWESWIRFFLKGVIETANQAADAAQQITLLFQRDHERIVTAGRSTSAVIGIQNYLQRHPIVTTTQLKKECKKSLPTIIRSLAVLEDLCIVKEITGRQRRKTYVYKDYFDILSKGTEPIR